MLEFYEEVQLRLPGTLTRRAEEQPMLAPASARAVAHVVELAHKTGTALEVPGSAPRPERPALRLDRLDDILSVDESSRILHVQAGIELGDVEARASDYGWTLGVADAHHEERVGAWLARGAPGRAAKADDPVQQLVAGLEFVLPSGAELSIRPAPRRAVGPDLIRTAIGARGRIGVIVGAHLVARARTAETTLAFSFPDRERAERALAWLRGRGVRPRGAAVSGTELQLVVEAEGPRYRAAMAVARRVAHEHDGSEIEAPSEIPVVDPMAPASTKAFDRLTKALDPKGVLQP